MSSNVNHDLELVGALLLNYLREYYKDDLIEYKKNPSVISGGFEASVFMFEISSKLSYLNKPMILRINHHTYDEEQFSYDTFVIKTLCKYNIPVARLHISCHDKSIFGGYFWVMDYIYGDVMWKLAEEKIPSLLADTHIRLHSYDANKIIEDTANEEFLGKCLIEPIKMAISKFEEMSIYIDHLKEWLTINKPKSQDFRICHGDFHPNNLLVKSDRVIGILDWHFSISEPEYDVALTIKILTINSKVHADDSEWHKLDDMASKYLNAYRTKRQLDTHKLEYYTVVHCLRDLGEGIFKGGKFRTNPYRVEKQLEIIEDITKISFDINKIFD